MTAARHAPVLALLAIALSTAAARLPLMWLPRPYGDEMMYALVGHQWLAGHLAEGYRLVARVGNAEDPVDVFQRMDR